jgi:hypothetical protein
MGLFRNGAHHPDTHSLPKPRGFRSYGRHSTRRRRSAGLTAIVALAALLVLART